MQASPKGLNIYLQPYNFAFDVSLLLTILSEQDQKRNHLEWTSMCS